MSESFQVPALFPIEYENSEILLPPEKEAMMGDIH